MSHPSLPEIIDSLEYYYFLAKAGINYDIAYLKSELNSGFKDTRKKAADSFYEAIESAKDLIYENLEKFERTYKRFIDSFKAHDNHMPFQPVTIHRRTSTYWKQVAFNTTIFAVSLGLIAGLAGGYFYPNHKNCQAAIQIKNDAENTFYKGNPIEINGAIIFGNYASTIYTTEKALSDGVLKSGEFTGYFGCWRLK